MKEKLIIIAGPTGVGKTSLSLELAKRLDSEIISADSMQIYKHMNIGTDKVREDEMQDIPHHLVDFLDLDREFSVSDYREQAKEKISQINAKGKIPILVGGTGLYINSLVYDLNFTRVASNDHIRDRLEKELEDYGNQHLLDKLEKVDPKSAQRIHLNDARRIIRALEIYEVTGKPMSEHNKDFRKTNNEYDLTMIALNRDRQDLYESINARVDMMMERGLIEEVQGILDMGYDKNLVSMQGIGYKEIIMYLDGEISLERAVELIKQGSRNYAKRQLTWFKRDDRIRWFDLDAYPDFKSLKEEVIEYVIQRYK